jgi:hypothetical protein
MADKFDNIRKSIDGLIASLEKSEAATRSGLAEVAATLLVYVPETQDIARVNRLLTVLNRPNQEMAMLFFAEFLEWKLDDKAKIFGAKLKGETKLKRFAEKRVLFLKSGKDIWTWGRENIAPAKRKTDFEKNLAALIDRATAEKNSDGSVNESQIEPIDVFNVVMNKLTLDRIMSFVTDAANAVKAEAEKVTEKEKALEPPTIEGKAVEKQRKAA